MANVMEFSPEVIASTGLTAGDASTINQSNYNSSSSQSSSSGPAYTQYAPIAAENIESTKASAQSAATAQLARYQDYIKRLAALKQIVEKQAKSGITRGAAGAQNPGAVYQAAMAEAQRAGIPIDAEMQKVLQGSTNIENTLNQILQNATQQYVQLSGIMASQSQGQSQSGGLGSSSGGGGGGGRGASITGNRGGGGQGGAAGGLYTDIHGRQYNFHPSNEMVQQGSGVNQVERQRAAQRQAAMNLDRQRAFAGDAGAINRLNDPTAYMSEFERFQYEQDQEKRRQMGLPTSGNAPGVQTPNAPDSFPSTPVANIPIPSVQGFGSTTSLTEPPRFETGSPQSNQFQYRNFAEPWQSNNMDQFNLETGGFTNWNSPVPEWGSNWSSGFGLGGNDSIWQNDMIEYNPGTMPWNETSYGNLNGNLNLNIAPADPNTYGPLPSAGMQNGGLELDPWTNPWDNTGYGMQEYVPNIQAPSLDFGAQNSRPVSAGNFELPPEGSYPWDNPY